MSGKNLKDFLDMIDAGQINEAENILLDSIDYTNKDEVIAAALFYQHLSERNSVFFGKQQLYKGRSLFRFQPITCVLGIRLFDLFMDGL